MELAVALVLLYAAQCLMRLPRGAVLFSRPLWGWRWSVGPGWRLAHPVPSVSTLVGTRIPLVDFDGALHGRGASGWLSGGPSVGPGPPFDPGAGEPIEVRSSVIRVGGRPFGEGGTREHAARLARWLEGLGDSGPVGVWDELGNALAASHSLEAFREERDRLRAHTRWLRVLADVYAACLLVGLPLLMLRFGSEAVLLRTWPLLALLHIATLIAFVAAHRRLAPGRTGDLVGTVIGIALYPPLLLRASQDLEMDALAGYHPACLAAALLDEAPRRDFLRAELVRSSSGCDRNRDRNRDEGGLVQLEQRALEDLAARAGESPAALLATPEPSDALAESYCPACHVEYRRIGGRCSDCNLPLAAYPKPAR